MLETQALTFPGGLVPREHPAQFCWDFCALADRASQMEGEHSERAATLEGPKMIANVSHLLTPVQGCCRQELLK